MSPARGDPIAERVNREAKEILAEQLEKAECN